MKVSEKVEIEMKQEIVSMIVAQDQCGQTKDYDNVVYIVLTNPIKLYNSGRGIREFSVLGFVDQEAENIMVGNLNWDNTPYFEKAEDYRNSVLNIYAQLCGVVVGDSYKC